MTPANRFSALLILPLVIFVAAFFLLPMSELFVRSFASRGGGITYAEIIATPRYLSSLVATLVVALLTTVITLVLSTLVGLLLARSRFPGRAVLRPEQQTRLDVLHQEHRQAFHRFLLGHGEAHRGGHSGGHVPAGEGHR